MEYGSLDVREPGGGHKIERLSLTIATSSPSSS